MSGEHVWTYDYANDGNGFFCEWWNILRDGDKIGTVTTSENDAKMTCAMLNAAGMLSADQAGKLAKTLRIKGFPKAWVDALQAYADAREGRKA